MTNRAFRDISLAHPHGRRTKGVIPEKPERGGLHRIRVEVASQPQPEARGDRDLGIHRLIRGLRQHQLRQAVGKRAEEGAGAAVVHDEIDMREQACLVDERHDAHVGAERTEVGVADRAQGDENRRVQSRHAATAARSTAVESATVPNVT